MEALVAESFGVPARALLSPVTATSTGSVYQSLGALWQACASEAEKQHRSGELPIGEGMTLDEEVKEMVMASMDSLWSELAPTLDGNRVPKRITSIEKAWREATARARTAGAANRAAAALHGPRPAFVPLSTPSKGSAARAEAASAEIAPEAAGPQDDSRGPDLVETLLARMGSTPAALPPSRGKDQGGAPSGPAAHVVPPSLERACRRLTEVGCIPLRVDRLAPGLAGSMLTSQPTFTDYVERKHLTGAHGREAATLARSLDLGVCQYGPSFMASDTAEVQVRRLLAVCLGVRMGSFKLASLLEELPGDQALAEVPDALLKVLMERMKLEDKVSQLAQGASPAKP